MYHSQLSSKGFGNGTIGVKSQKDYIGLEPHFKCVRNGGHKTKKSKNFQLLFTISRIEEAKKGELGPQTSIS